MSATMMHDRCTAVTTTRCYSTACKIRQTDWLTTANLLARWSQVNSFTYIKSC